MGALDGYRVIDLSRVLAGPFCGQLLADNGAEVIKVEAPGGDLNRVFPHVFDDGRSSNFLSVNRGKKDITLNLKSERALDILYRLVADADVVIQSFLPDTAEKLGVGYERLKEVNPGLIYCSVSGYGAKGPLRNKPGYDTMVAAYSGIFSLTGEADRPPVRPGVTVIDLSTGMLAYSGITTALLAKERAIAAGEAPEGQRVDVSLLESGVTLLGFHAIGWLAGGLLDQREGAGYTTIAPYGVYACADGEILIGAPSEAMWQKLCPALEAEHLLTDPRYRTNTDRCAHQPELRQDLEAILAGAGMTEWIARLEAAGVATAPINTIDKVLSDEQVLANDMVVPAETPDGSTVDLIGLPFKLSRTPGLPGAAPPKPGQHNQEILAGRLGMTADDIRSLEEDGSI